MKASLFMFLIIILVLLLFVTGIVLLVRWIVRSTEKNQKFSTGKLLQYIPNKRCSAPAVVRNFHRKKISAASAESSAQHPHKVRNLYFNNR